MKSRTSAPFRISARVTTPSSRPHSATATATSSETSRIRSTEGKTWPRAISSSVTASAQATEAARSIASVTTRHSAMDAPRPTPGNTNMLLHCDGVYVLPFRSTGSKGDPDAKTTSPSVHSIASAYETSHFEVGFDSGMMMGRSGLTLAWNVLTTASSKSPATVDAPMSIVGLAYAMTSSNESPRVAAAWAKFVAKACCSGARDAKSASAMPSFASKPSFSMT
mmetsp:Transcript_27154/g.83685  ORF Transcript_27154/g.83685 Transcript_27154/m.83685 type:complete len:223 (+) Transcript_27154:103-771(+)